MAYLPTLNRFGITGAPMLFSTAERNSFDEQLDAVALAASPPLLNI